jgi:hypothetical protein
VRRINKYKIQFKTINFFGKYKKVYRINKIYHKNNVLIIEIPQIIKVNDNSKIFTIICCEDTRKTQEVK